MKHFTLLGLLFAVMSMAAFNASADDDICNFYAKECAIKAGETKTIKFYIDNNIAIQDWMFQMFFPEGITPVEDEDNEAYFVPQGNAKKSSVTVTEKYFPATRNLRVLSVNLGGKVVFTAGGGIIGYITVKAADDFTGKEAIQIISQNGSSDSWAGNKGDYYTDPDDKSTLVAINSEDIDCYIYPALTYAGQITSMVQDGMFGFSDLAAVSYQDGVLYCKDNNGYASKDAKKSNEIDYMSSVSSIQDSYDQSNWIALKLPEGTTETTGKGLEGKYLNDVFGTVSSASNFELTLDEVPETGDDADEYAYNTYIAASFGGTQVSSVNGSTYFFVTPKPMEVANIKWVQWDATNSKFIVPSKNGVAVNGAGLSGSFSVDYSLLSETPSLTDGYIYSLKGVIKKSSSASGAQKKVAAASEYVVTLLEEPTLTKGGSVTGIDDINAANADSIRKVYENGQVVIYKGNVKYNAMGAEIK